MALIRRGEVFHYKFMFHGKRIQRSAQTGDRRLAQQIEAKHRQKLHAGYFGLEDEMQSNKTLRDALDAYLVALKVKRPGGSNVAEYGSRHLIRHLGDEFVTMIGPEAVIRYRAKRQAEGAAVGTVDGEVSLLCRGTGIRGKLLRDRLRETKSFELNTNRELKGRAYTPVEQELLLATAAEKSSRYFFIELVIRLALNCGLRKGEIRKLTWARIDFVKSALQVGKSKSAGSTGRIVPWNDEVEAEFNRYCAWYGQQFGKRLVNGEAPRDWFVFPHTRRGVMDPTRPIASIDVAWRAVRKAAGVKGRFHDCRHTTCSMLGEAGASPEQMRTIMGHMSDAMVRRYCHISLNASRELLNKLPKHRAEMRDKELEERQRSAERFAGLSETFNDPTKPTTIN